MAEGLISILAICGALLLVGATIGLIDRKNFAPRWLLIASALVLINDIALTRFYGLIPSFIGEDWNWIGKGLALIITLAIASMPGFGWRRSGLTLRQDRSGIVAALIVSLLMIVLFTWLALGPNEEPTSAETYAYQLTMPGLEEEPFYRGILLLALSEAFRGRLRALGIDWSWGALLTSILFGLTHAFAFDDGAFSFDLMPFLMTGVPALILVWLRERTGSLLLPILLHNYANSIGHFV
jgi:membrane protease YdiL (CAAX protease family)